MKRLFTDIHKWSIKTFINAKPEHHILKMIEEANEVIESNDISEYADCFIALISGATRSGYSYDQIVKAINYKLDVNKKRKWIEQPDGTHQHVNINS